MTFYIVIIIVLVIVALFIIGSIKGDDLYYEELKMIRCRHTSIKNDKCQDCGFDFTNKSLKGTQMECKHVYLHRESTWRGYDDHYDYDVCDDCGYTKFLS